MKKTGAGQEPRTYQSRLTGLGEQAQCLLEGYAQLYGRVERTLFADIARGATPERLKSHYLRRFGISARQFNAICRNLKGKIASIRERRSGLIAEGEARIKKAQKVIGKLEKSLKKAQGPDRTKLKNKLHFKRRRLETLQRRHAQRQDDQANATVRLCFGSRRLFRAQFDLKANGYASVEQWREDWRRERNGQFYALGSKDETAGCQGCVGEYLGDDRFALRLRLPDALVPDNGGQKYLHLEMKLAYGSDHLVAALTLGQAVSYRFKRDKKGWRVFVSTQALPFDRRSDRRLGVIGVDLNADHLAVCETDRFGNPLDGLTIPLVTYGATRHQAQARIGEAIKTLMNFARGKHKPLAVEKLDFSAKKASLEDEGGRYARMLSSLSYTLIVATLKARAHDQGLEVLERNPAYTSLIGRYKFAHRYGLCGHQAAALCIARRAMNLSEQPNRRDQNAPALPVRNRARHVWSFWRQVAQQQRRMQRTGGRPPRRSCGSPPSGKAPTADPITCCGRDSRTPIVTTTVRVTSWNTFPCF